MEHRWRVDYSVAAKTAYKATLKELHRSMKVARKDYIATRINNSDKLGKELFKVVNSFLKPRELMIDAHPSRILCGQISDFFDSKIRMVCNSFTAEAETVKTDVRERSDWIFAAMFYPNFSAGGTDRRSVGRDTRMIPAPPNCGRKWRILLCMCCYTFGIPFWLLASSTMYGSMPRLCL